MPELEPIPATSKHRSRIVRYNINDVHCSVCRMTIGQRRNLLALMLEIRKPANRKRSFLPAIKCQCWECTVATIYWTNKVQYYDWIKYGLPLQKRKLQTERAEKEKDIMPQVETIPERKPRNTESETNRVEWIPSLEAIVEFAKANHNNGEMMITLKRGEDWNTERKTIVPRPGSKSTTKVGVAVFRKLKPVLEKAGFAVTEKTSVMTDDIARFTLEPIRVPSELADNGQVTETVEN